MICKLFLFGIALILSGIGAVTLKYYENTSLIKYLSVAYIGLTLNTMECIMKIKKITAAVACAALLSSQIGVAAESVKNLPTTGLMDDAKTFSIGSSTTNPDISFAFDLNQGTAFEMASLSDVEMDETEGASYYHAVRIGVGALYGGYSAGYGYYAGGGRSWGGFASTTLAGAAAGAWTPIRSFGSAIRGLGAGFSGGFASGWAGSRWGW